MADNPTTFSEIETMFHSMPLTKYVIAEGLEQEWLKAAVADYELDLSCDLAYDKENHVFAEKLSDITIRVLALMMYVCYLQRELSRVMALNGIYGKDILYYPWGYVAVQRSSGYWDVYHCSGRKVDFYSDESPYIFWNGCWCIKQGSYWYACDGDGDKIDGVYGDKITLLDNGNWKCVRGRYVSYVEQ